jgi:DNA invertase Pin-like site-specific DNA recombinase
MTKRVVLYARESRDGCSIASQLLILNEIANSRKWSIVKTYADRTIYSTKDKHDGMSFFELRDALTRSEFDLVMAFSIDRFGKSLQELMRFLENLHENNIDLYIHTQSIDTLTLEGKIIFSMCRIFGDYEHAIMSERVTAGINRARNHGKKLGRPRVSLEIEKQILTYRSQGMAIKPIAQSLKIGTSVVQRVLRVAND